MIHTIAHLANVINFSRNFSSQLADLNVASFKHQNPLELVASVPAVTGFLMLLILLLMSLSSADFVRNSRYDLFHWLHRLSVVFVVLLVMHPTAHLLKQQSNVDRHNPDLCSTLLFNQSSTSPPAVATSSAHSLHNYEALVQEFSSSPRRASHTSSPSTSPPVSALCPDSKPKFVAQCSLSGYFLGVGVVCYLLDLLMRRRIRSKNAVELREASITLPASEQQTSGQQQQEQDRHASLVELKLSNNHRRFECYMPGQFVYLNCALVSSYEWHPFTVSSMDKNHLTLHIKTGGDWTRNFANLLLSLRASQQQQTLQQVLTSLDCASGIDASHEHDTQFLKKTTRVRQTYKLASAHNQKLHATQNVIGGFEKQTSNTCQARANCELPLNASSLRDQTTLQVDNKQQCAPEDNSQRLVVLQDAALSRLQLHLDGPFHSPFERLLEQSVSVCVSNGVGWTAFSPVFQQIAKNIQLATRRDSRERLQTGLVWWKNLNKPTTNTVARLGNSVGLLPRASSDLYLLVTVTNLEQFLPFYKLACAYLEHARASVNDRSQAAIDCSQSQEQQVGFADPLKQLSVYLTRGK